MTASTESPRHITGGTGVALSLVISLLVAALSVGGTYVTVQWIRADVTALQVWAETEKTSRHLQALELTELRSELRAVRESQARVERSLEQLTTRRALPVRSSP